MSRQNRPISRTSNSKVKALSVSTMALALVPRAHSMTNTSMTMGAVSFSEQQSEKKLNKEQAFHKMQINLVQCARTSDKDTLLQSLRDVKVLKCLNLDSTTEDSSYK
jgi:hypothetical protein